MATDNLAEQVGKAWRYEREGKTTEAVAEYDRILEQDANHIDANYGMGLAQRRAGYKEEAMKYFQIALDLTEAALTRRRQADGLIGSDGQPLNNPGTIEDDRYMMLIRMTNQRLSEISAGKK